MFTLYSDIIFISLHIGIISMNHVIGLSKISGKQQVTLPKDVMEKLNVKANDKILWVLENNQVTVKKA